MAAAKVRYAEALLAATKTRCFAALVFLIPANGSRHETR
jgi:hypothetical protein